MARIVIIGAGAGGLASALALAGAGFDVVVLERAGMPGGKMRALDSAAGPVDAGPTVFTMRFVFEDLFAGAGLAFEDFVRVAPLEVLARHTWRSDPRPFDLYADPARAADAIGRFFGAREAHGFQRFLKDSANAYRCLLDPFMAAQKPDPLGLASRVGVAGLVAARPFATLWQALGGYFRDPRLRQLFARYATYTGASPFAAPATLMLIAHVEQAGVWAVEGGMRALALGLAQAAASCGARFRYHTHARNLVVESGRVCGVISEAGEHFPADAVILNADPSALSAGAFGPHAKAIAPKPLKRVQRSLSALTFTGAVKASGFSLARHNVFFSDAYRAEFDAIFRHAALPQDPTIYVCAQDRPTPDDAAPPTERVLILVNAPAAADAAPLSEAEIDQCQDAIQSRLKEAGLRFTPIGPFTLTRPQDFHRLFPHTGGAIYGPAAHGPFAPFQRMGARTKLPGLYLAGGGVHPSAGVPMATLSGMLAAAALRADRPLTRPSLPAATAGGTSMRSATTAASD
jgi:1-hydroxycarotenoid 3,4-desaturase